MSFLNTRFRTEVAPTFSRRASDVLTDAASATTLWSSSDSSPTAAVASRTYRSNITSPATSRAFPCNAPPSIVRSRSTIVMNSDRTPSNLSSSVDAFSTTLASLLSFLRWSSDSRK